MGVIQHIKTVTVPDSTNTGIVRPVDWNSGHAYTLQDAVSLAGNTVGALADISSGRLILAGGNNVTLSQGGNSVTISGPHTSQFLTTAMASNRGSDFVQATAAFAGTSASGTIASNGISVSIGPYLTTAMASNRGSDFVQATAAFAGTNASGTIASGGISVSVAAGGGDAIRAIAAGGSTQTTNTVHFSNSNGVSFGFGAGGNSTVITGSHNALTSQSTDYNFVSLVGNTAGTNTFAATNARTLYLSGGANVTLSGNASSIGISAAAGGGGGGATLSRFEVVSLDTGSAASSHAPASWWFNPFYLPAPLTFSNIWVLKSLSLAANAATSTNSSGVKSIAYTHGVTIFQRQNWGTGSTNLTTVTTGSMGLSVRYSHTSGSQSLSASWVTNTTGGTSSFSTTSGASNLVLFFQSNRQFAIPMVTSLSAGEYFIAHRHSSTTGTTNINSTAASFSNIHAVYQSVTYKQLGISAAAQSNSSAMPAGIGFGVASAVTTTTTMAASVVSAGTQNYWYANFVNLPAS